MAEKERLTLALANQEWVEDVTTGAYQAYYKAFYGG